MKSIYVRILFGIALVTAPLAMAQGTFQNLNFEEANIVPIDGQTYAVTVANALPDWTVDYGTVQQTQITYNVPSEGGTTVTLLANGYPTLTGDTPLDGNFSIELNGGRTSVSFSQTGLIPVGSQSIVFEGAWFPGGPEPTVSIGSDSLTLFPVGSEHFGANISGFAGQTSQLTFTVPGGAGVYVFDDISFSPNAVTPEPDAVILMGIGGALFAAYRRFAPKCR